MLISVAIFRSLSDGRVEVVLRLWDGLSICYGTALYTPDMLSLLRLRSGLCVCTIWSFGLTSIRDLKRRYNDFLRDINDWIIHLVMLQFDSWDILFGLVLV
jgi:hypothetical protein